MTINAIKRIIIMPFLLLCVLAMLHSLLMLFGSDGNTLAWLGAALATASLPGFMLYLAKANTSSTTAHMPVQLTLSTSGALMTLLDFHLTAAAYAWLLGLCGTYIYVFWYSRLGRVNSVLSIGQVLPAFTVRTEHGEPFSSDSLLGTPSLILFYRGNWCPLCVAQVNEIAAQYQTLAAHGAETIFISTQAQKETQKLARRFDIPLRFLVDDQFKASNALGLTHHYGNPALLGLDSTDTSYPTIIITDVNNHIVWLDQTDNYRVRPEPAQYLSVITALTNKPNS